jgi:type II secretory pathway pseudopilin PulG
MTMIEILIVIGIILILMGIALAGLAYSLRSSNINQTKAILQDLSAMTAEAELIKPLPDFLQEPTLNARPELEPYGKQVTINGNALTYVPQYLEVDVGSHSVPHQPYDVPNGSGSLSYSTGGINITTTINNSSDPAPPSAAEVYTAYVLNKLSSLPKNQELLSKISSTRFTQITIPKTYAGIISTWYENPPGSGSYTMGSWPQATQFTAAQPLILPVPIDAWGHEIYFVPGGGLVNGNWGTAANFSQAPTTANPAGLLSSVLSSSSRHLTQRQILPGFRRARRRHAHGR